MNFMSDKDYELERRVLDIEGAINNSITQIRSEYISKSISLKSKGNLPEHLCKYLDKCTEEAVKQLEKVRDELDSFINNKDI